MSRNGLILTICGAVGLVLIVGLAPAAVANGMHRECEEDSSGAHRHTPSGERVPCSRDLLQDPVPGRDRDRDRERGTTQQTNSGRTDTGSDPGRDAIGGSDAGPPAAGAPARGMRRFEKRQRP